MQPADLPMTPNEWLLRGLHHDLYEAYAAWLLERATTPFMRAVMARDWEEAEKRCEVKLGELDWRALKIFIESDMPRWCSGTWRIVKMWMHQSRLPHYQLAIDSLITGRAAPLAQWNEALRGMPYADRDPFVRIFGWAIPCHEVLTVLSAYPTIHDAFAGTGWFAFLLARYKNVRPKQQLVIATDGYADQHKHNGMAFGRWFPVRKLSAQMAGKRISATLTLAAWPDDNSPSDEQLYRAIHHGKFVAYIGENTPPPQGAMGSERGFEVLRKGFDVVQQLQVPNWGGFTDQLTIYRRHHDPIR